MKVVINRCYGGFAISKKAAEFMATRGNAQAKAELEKSDGARWYGYGYIEGFDSNGYKRDDADLVAAVEELKGGASGELAQLEIVEIPDGVSWEIEEYDGIEWIAESHRTWR